MPEYELSRPGYPALAVTAAMPGDRGSLIDVGAGTGKFSLDAARLRPDVRITAIEPSSKMRSGWPFVPENVQLQAGTSENTGLPDAFADRIVWAQSFHWVDRERTGPEAIRILKPNGHGVVLANQMNTEVPWVHRLTRIMRSGDVVRKWKPPELPGFKTSAPKSWAWYQIVTPEGLMTLARTRSSYIQAKPAIKEKMQSNLRWYLHDHLGFAKDAVVALPYVTYLWQLDQEPT